MKSKKSVSRLKITLLGTAVMVVSINLCTAAIAYLVIKGYISERPGWIVSKTALLISCVIGFLLVGKNVNEKIAVYTGLSGIMFVLVLTVLGFLLTPGKFQIGWGSVLCVVISYLIGCAACIRNKRNRRVQKQHS